MAWYILQQDFTPKKKIKDLWEPMFDYVVKSDMTQDPDFAYYPKINHNGFPVLVESATKLDVEFQHYHKFKLDKNDFKSSSKNKSLQLLEKKAPFEKNCQVNSEKIVKKSKFTLPRNLVNL